MSPVPITATVPVFCCHVISAQASVRIRDHNNRRATNRAASSELPQAIRAARCSAPAPGSPPRRCCDRSPARGADLSRRPVHTRRSVRLSRTERHRALDPARAGAARTGRGHAGHPRRGGLGDRGTSGSKRSCAAAPTCGARLGAFRPCRGTGLRPAREYWYRFASGGAQSPVGRTRTAPPPGAGRHARARGRDLPVLRARVLRRVSRDGRRRSRSDRARRRLHLRQRGIARVRSHEAPEAYTLDDYRHRYALYKSDPDLQAAHAACAWMVASDDHEVDNDYAGETRDGEPAEVFLARRAAAYQAYYEHMPLPRRLLPSGRISASIPSRASGISSRCTCSTAANSVRRKRAAGQLVSRASRSMTRSAPCSARHRNLAARGAWLESRSLEFARPANADRALRSKRRGRNGYWADGWSGYPVARARLVDSLAERRRESNRVERRHPRLPRQRRQPARRRSRIRDRGDGARYDVDRLAGAPQADFDRWLPRTRTCGSRGAITEVICVCDRAQSAARDSSQSTTLHGRTPAHTCSRHSTSRGQPGVAR